MVWIEATTEESVLVRAEREAAFMLVKDIATVGKLFPGVDRVDDRGGGVFRFLIAERSTLGVKFVGEYTNQYTERGPETYAFESFEGNMKVRGAWVVRGPDGAITVSQRITTELDVPVPRLLRAPVQLFAERELSTGVKAQLAGIRRLLESRG
ncbi:MAG: SRPBCC family protein [Deltaproteobacteria bacterium]|nr:SRPBCC family protein [Deltaproteobacteria bacterium]